MGCASARAHQSAGQDASSAIVDQVPSAPIDTDATDTDVCESVDADEERINSAIAQLPPDGSTWGRFGGAELEPLLAYTDVIDALWLLKLAKGEVMPERKGVVPPWQLLPAEAKLDLATLRKTTMKFVLPIAVLSYGWAAPHHPDPTGAQLQRLVPVLEAMVHSTQHGISKSTTTEKPAAWGIVWDFMSLPQRGYTTGYDPQKDDRTPYQLGRFIKGLGSINVWYGAVYVTTVVCDWPMPECAQNTVPIDRRGWCIFERRLSSIRKDDDCCLCVSQLSSCKLTYLSEVRSAGKAGRFPPLAPDDFDRMLHEGMALELTSPGTGYRFTNGKDATEVCLPQYRSAFFRLMALKGEMPFSNTKWGVEDVQQLAAALKAAHAGGVPTQANLLRLTYNQLPDAALPPLIEVMLAGAAPKLNYFTLQQNEFGDGALEVLSPLLRSPWLSSQLKTFGIGSKLTACGVQMLRSLADDGFFPKLKWLVLNNNKRLGDEGATALGGALSKGSLPAMEKLELANTGMCDAGALELACALKHAPAMRILNVGKNALTQEGIKGLRRACSEHGNAKAMASASEEL